MLRASLFKLPMVANLASAIAVGVLLAVSMLEYRTVSDQLVRWKQGVVSHSQLYKTWLQAHSIRQALGEEEVPLSQGVVGRLMNMHESTNVVIYTNTLDYSQFHYPCLQ